MPAPTARGTLLPLAHPEARAHLATMAGAELDEFERLIGLEDPQLMGWVVGREAVPTEFAGELTTKILSWRPEIY